MATAKKVLLIGWDAADWQFITPLLDAGKMPALAKFISQGVMGNIGTLRPILSPILWNSIATGKRAHKHGIYGFVEPRSDGDGIQPVSSTSRKTKAIWNILTQAGLRTHVVGWFASHPAEPINGVCVANTIAKGTKEPADTGSLPPNCVHPARVAAAIAELRVSTEEIGEDDVLPFIPNAAEIDQKTASGQQGLQNFRSSLAQCATIHNAFTWALANEPWDFAAVYYEAVDHFGHNFMAFHPPQMKGVSDADFRLYSEVMTGVYRYHDMMLATLMKQVDDDTLVIITSDHGFFSDHMRPPIRNGKLAGPVAWHRPYGMVAMRGPGILKDERIYGATILDIVPTILTALGLPVGQDMDGKVLAAAFEKPPTVTHIPSWDEKPGNAGTHPPEMQSDPLEAQEALQQLADLGYIDAPTGDKKKQVEIAVRELKFNAAMAHMDVRQYDRAIELLTQLLEGQNDPRFGMALANVYLAMGEYAKVRESLAPYEHLRVPMIDLLMGQVLAAEGDLDGSMKLLERAQESTPQLPKLHLELGALHLRKGRWSEAKRAFESALATDGDNASAYHGLSVVLGKQRQYEQAAELALRAVGLRHFYPAAHFQLGAMIAHLDEPERAAKCFEIGLQMQPHTLIAHRYLSRIYKRLGQVEKAQYHRAAAGQLLEAAPARIRSRRKPVSSA